MDCGQAYAVLNVDTDCLSVRMRIQRIFQDISNVDSKCLSGCLKCGVKAFIRIFQMKAFAKKVNFGAKSINFGDFPRGTVVQEELGHLGAQNWIAEALGIMYVALFFMALNHRKSLRSGQFWVFFCRFRYFRGCVCRAHGRHRWSCTMPLAGVGHEI